jgi:hypothetical protein
VKHDNGMDLTSSAMFTTLKKRIYNIYYWLTSSAVFMILRRENTIYIKSKKMNIVSYICEHIMVKIISKFWLYTHTHTHTHISLIQHSSTDRWIWNMSGDVKKTLNNNIYIVRKRQVQSLV